MATSVLVAGSLLLYNMLFTSEGDLEPWLTSPFSSSLLVGLDGEQPMTNENPDLPPKPALLAPRPAPDERVQAPIAGDVEPPAGTDDADSSGQGSAPVDDPAGEESSDEGSSSGSGSGGGDDSSGPGSGGDDGDSSGHGSGGSDDGDSSGHGSGGSDDDSSGHGSGHG